MADELITMTPAEKKSPWSKPRVIGIGLAVVAVLVILIYAPGILNSFSSSHVKETILQNPLENNIEKASGGGSGSGSTSSNNQLPNILSISSNPTVPTATQPVKLSATVSGGVAPYTFSWTVVKVSDGSTVGTYSTQNPSHTFAAASKHKITLTITDSKGNTATKSSDITPAPAPPAE